MINIGLMCIPFRINFPHYSNSVKSFSYIMNITKLFLLFPNYLFIFKEREREREREIINLK